MRIVVSVLLAWLLVGISQAMRDLRTNVVDRPLWASQPTLGMWVFVVLTGPARPFLFPAPQTARKLVFGILGSTMQLGMMTGFVWLCITIANHLVSSVILRILTSAALVYVGSLLVLPLVSVVMTPLLLILAWPLDLLFPLKERDK
jgi:hypothetical protein